MSNPVLGQRACPAAALAALRDCQWHPTEPPDRAQGNRKTACATPPRHLVYHPSRPIVYFSNEQHLGVSSYDIRNSGQLKLRQVVEGVSADEPREGTTASDLVITPDGKYLFSGIRGLQREFDQIARYKVKESGELERLGQTKADKIPWGLELSPESRYLLVAAVEGATLTVYRIDDSGELNVVASQNWDPKISDLIAR